MYQCELCFDTAFFHGYRWVCRCAFDHTGHAIFTEISWSFLLSMLWLNSWVVSKLTDWILFGQSWTREGTHPVPPVTDGTEDLVSTVHTLWKRCTPSLYRSTSIAWIYLLVQTLPLHRAALAGSRGLPQQLPLVSELLFRTLQKDSPLLPKETEGLTRI